MRFFVVSTTTLSITEHFKAAGYIPWSTALLLWSSHQAAVELQISQTDVKPEFGNLGWTLFIVVAISKVIMPRWYLPWNDGYVCVVGLR